MTEVIVVRRRTAIGQTRPIVFAGLAFVMAIVAAINLSIGITMYCNYDSYCDYRKRAYIISGSCFVVSTVCFVIAAISTHMKNKAAMRMSQSTPNREIVTVGPEYPVQPVVSFPVVQTQYSPPYAPQAGAATPYPVTPVHQHTPQVGFAVSQPEQPYPQVTQPPPYVP